MAFYSSKKILINRLLSLTSMVVVGLAFQNCSNGLSSKSPTSNAAANDTSSMHVISDPEGTQAPITTDLKIELLATDLLKVDCSLPDSGYKFEISNAGSDILMCQEYTLDMPQGNSRYGESYKCDSSNKFVRPPSSWSYDVGQRKWSKTTYTNSDRFTPGDYRLYVRDNLGEAKSSLLKMRHYGYVNCVNQTIAEPSMPSPMQTVPSSISPVDNSTRTSDELIIVKILTQIPDKTFIKAVFFPDAKTIYSFQFRTPPASSTMKLGGATATQLSSTSGGKLIVISNTVGDIVTSNKDLGCFKYAGESTRIEYITNYAQYLPETYCNLKPNSIYYFNIVPRETTNGQSNCTSKESCGFSFQAY